MSETLLGNIKGPKGDTGPEGPSSIVEKGSNQYGSWVKYTNGVMICYYSLESNFPVTPKKIDIINNLWRYEGVLTLPQPFKNNTYTITHSFLAITSSLYVTDTTFHVNSKTATNFNYDSLGAYEYAFFKRLDIIAIGEY